MILPRFELLEPTSVKEACEVLKSNDSVRVIAGGTDLLVNMKKKILTADVLVSLDKIKGLNEISYEEKSGLSVGPMVRIADLAASTVVQQHYPALALAAGKLGSPQIRNRATLGGNICSARPAADTIGPLIGYGAVVRISGPGEDREVPVENFFKGPGQTNLGKGEFLSAITAGAPDADSRASYIKHGIRRSMEISLVNVTSVLSMDNGTCSSARLVLGAVAPTFIRCPVTEGFLAGKAISEDVAEQAGHMAVDICTPITDIRASADYRRQLVRVLVKRCLLQAVEAN